jgi:hypothetical protein
VILLVLLGGGAGLLTIWLIDSSSLSWLGARREGRSLRSDPPDHTTAASPPAPVAATPPAPDPAVHHGSGTGPAPGPELEPEPTGELQVVAAGAAPRLPRVDRPTGRRADRAERVPAAFTAVEGTYRDVVVLPWWRKLTSLVLLLAVLAGAGAVVAALAGIGFAAVAELVDRAIG